MRNYLYLKAFNKTSLSLRHGVVKYDEKNRFDILGSIIFYVDPGDIGMYRE